MKKYLLFLFVFLFTSMSANALTSVKYMGGTPIGISRGGGAYVNYRIGPHASYNERRSFHNHRPPMPPMGGRGRYMNGRMGMYGGPAPRGGMNNTSHMGNRPPEVSRLSKDYSIPTAKKYTRGNVTYYN
jgi:hypothetical protein